MQINLKTFGPLTDIIKTNVVTLSEDADTDKLVAELKGLFPALADKKFMIAVDKKTISSNTILKQNSTVALLPPFSGG